MATSYNSIAIAFAVVVFLLLPFAVSAATVNVSAGDNFFSQKNITINQGDTVVWTNTGAMIHTVTADNNSFDSGNLSPGQTYSLIFNTPGTYPYYCKPHGSPGGLGMAGTVNVVAVATPPVQTSSGTTTDVLRAQIEDLLRRVEVLQQRIAAVGGGSPVSTSVAPSSGFTCPRVGVTLRRGSTGEDVTRLQQFLALDPSIYPEGLVTGYFGTLTEAAVARWQTRHNIVSSGSPETTGYGQYGPRTASLMAVKCQEAKMGATGAQVGGFIKVSPISGSAPLSVNVEATINTTRSCNVATYTVNFGDGSPVVNIPIYAGVCAEQKYTLTHIYQYGGTYSMELLAGGHKTQATVVVSGASPPPTVTSSCSTDIAAAQADASGKICTQVVANLLCPYNNSYVYSAPNGCQSDYLKARSWVVESESTLTVKYGGMSITPDPSGNYLTVEASFDVGVCDGYVLLWGDGYTSNQTSTTSCSSNSITTKTLSHTYSAAGTYSIELTRADQKELVEVVIVADY